MANTAPVPGAALAHLSALYGTPTGAALRIVGICRPGHGWTAPLWHHRLTTRRIDRLAARGVTAVLVRVSGRTVRFDVAPRP
ncbi:hypothetical protein ABN028_19495 [Actinopolymorpha sp. B17G11]|uniref:hypothetical protein n=1 Tax=Actinopolymorpha sp. B17G11 TaxID=3160861 RepID=UPI0032E3BB44